MKAYLVKTNGNNFVVITENGVAKIFDCAPDGEFEGIDLYSEDSAARLSEHFKGVAEASGFDFNDMYADQETSYDKFFEELEKCNSTEVILVYVDEV